MVTQPIEVLYGVPEPQTPKSRICKGNTNINYELKVLLDFQIIDKVGCHTSFTVMFLFGTYSARKR